MKPMLKSALATGALALFLAAPAAPLQAVPGSPGRSGPVQSHTGLEAIPVHDRWDHRHRRQGRHHGYPERRPYRQRPHRHRPNPHRPYLHWPHPHRAYPYWAYPYWRFPHPCIVEKPWPRGHWRHHQHRHGQRHRHPVPRHRHVRCHGGLIVVLPFPYPRPHAW